MEWGQPTNGSAARRHSSQSHGFAVWVWSNLCICSPGVVELVRSNLAPDFTLFHGSYPILYTIYCNCKVSQAQFLTEFIGLKLRNEV